MCAVMKIVLSILLIIFLALIPACYNGNHSAVQTKLSFSNTPALNESVKLTATFKYDISGNAYPKDTVARNVLYRIILPGGFVVIDGDLEKYGDFVTGNTYTLTPTVKAIKNGDWDIQARADYESSGVQVAAYTHLYISINGNQVMVDFKPQSSKNYVSGNINTPTISPKPDQTLLPY